MKTFKRLEPRTVLDIWMPRYSSAYTETGERVALLACYKVDHGHPWIVVEFTKAKHLIGQRYCISREEARRCPVDSNGKIACYAVPMSKLQPYDTADEIMQTINDIWPS